MADNAQIKTAKQEAMAIQNKKPTSQQMAKTIHGIWIKPKQILMAM